VDGVLAAVRLSRGEALGHLGGVMWGRRTTCCQGPGWHCMFMLCHVSADGDVLQPAECSSSIWMFA